jgi:hypothetical protein
MDFDIQSYIEKMIEDKLEVALISIREELHAESEKKLLEALDTKLYTYEEASQEFKVSIIVLKKLKKDLLLVPTTKGGRHFLFSRLNIIKALANRPKLKPKFIQ